MMQLSYRFVPFTKDTVNESTAFRSPQELVNKEQDGTGGKNAVFGAGKPFTVHP